MLILQLFLGPLLLAAESSIRKTHTPTPAGWWPNECVHEVPSGTRIRRNISGVHYKYPDGTEGFRENCTRTAFPNLPKKGSKTPAESGHAYPVIFWGNFANVSADLSKFTANYNVPKGPKKDEDQVIYWWLGVEPPSASDVLQPVLGWNGFGGPRWTFASWNCCPAGHTHYATPLNVSTGDNLYGALDSTGGDGYTVVSEFADHKGKASILKSDDELPQNAPLLSLETYNIVQDCALLPESEMEITSLAVSPKVSWDPDTPQGWALTSCGWKVGINGNNLVASPPTAHPVAEDVII